MRNTTKVTILCQMVLSLILMADMQTVSVIVPVYNAEPWIRQCIESLQAQTYKDMEIVFVNDGSTDNGSPLIPRDDDRIAISHTVHRGVSAARNEGIKGSSGELLMFVDADDYLEPGAVETLVQAIDGVDMVAGSFRKFGDFETIVTHETKTMTMEEVAAYVMGNLRNPRTNQMLSGCWAKLYRRSFVGEFPKLTTAEDMAFNFDYLTRCSAVRFIPEVVYHNRKHQGTLTTTFDEKDKTGLFGFLEALNYVETFLARHYYGYSISRAIDNSKMYHTMLYYSRICKQTGWPMREALLRLFP